MLSASTWRITRATNRISEPPYYVLRRLREQPGSAPYIQAWDAENQHVTKDSSTSFCTSSASFDGEGRLKQTSCLQPAEGYLAVYNAFGWNQQSSQRPERISPCLLSAPLLWGPLRLLRAIRVTSLPTILPLPHQ